MVFYVSSCPVCGKDVLVTPRNPDGRYHLKRHYESGSEGCDVGGWYCSGSYTLAREVHLPEESVATES